MPTRLAPNRLAERLKHENCREYRRALRWYLGWHERWSYEAEHRRSNGDGQPLWAGLREAWPDIDPRGQRNGR